MVAFCRIWSKRFLNFIPSHFLKKYVYFNLFGDLRLKSHHHFFEFCILPSFITIACVSSVLLTGFSLGFVIMPVLQHLLSDGFPFRQNLNTILHFTPQILLRVPLLIFPLYKCKTFHVRCYWRFNLFSETLKWQSGDLIQVVTLLSRYALLPPRCY